MTRPDRSSGLTSYYMTVPACFVTARSRHSRYSARLRERMTWNSDKATMRAQADNATREALGPFPGEPGYDPEEADGDPDAMHSNMRFFSEAAYESSRDADDFLWGLAIAGVYHCWESSAKDVVAAVLRCTDVTRLRNKDFKDLLRLLAKARFEVRGTPMYDRLNLIRLIANVAKHQDGKAMDELLELRRDLFVEKRGGLELKVGFAHFDDSVAAIDEFWADYGNVFRVL